MAIGDFTVHPEAPGKTAPSMTMRQAYKVAALQIIDSRYTNAGNEAACVYEVSRYAGLLADAMLAEDEAHAKK